MVDHVGRGTGFSRGLDWLLKSFLTLGSEQGGSSIPSWAMSPFVQAQVAIHNLSLSVDTAKLFWPWLYVHSYLGRQLILMGVVIRNWDSTLRLPEFESWIRTHCGNLESCVSNSSYDGYKRKTASSCFCEDLTTTKKCIQNAYHSVSDPWWTCTWAPFLIVIAWNASCSSPIGHLGEPYSWKTSYK